jgi:hypothetical protein
MLSGAGSAALPGVSRPSFSRFSGLMEKYFVCFAHGLMQGKGAVHARNLNVAPERLRQIWGTEKVDMRPSRHH